MKLINSKDATQMGEKAAEIAAESLNEAIEKKGKARLLLATGQSQLTTINALVEKKVEWGKVEAFHLDEYVNLTKYHKASFRKYLEERFVEKVNLKKMHFVDGEGDVEENIKELTQRVRESVIDVALIGIGENAHIAFNDPPADFETKEAYKEVQLDEYSRNQQVREGWFSTINQVPNTAITMTVYQIMQSEKIISSVPYKVKANPVKLVLESKIDNKVPATILKKHHDWTLFLDEESSSLINTNDYQ